MFGLEYSNCVVNQCVSWIKKLEIKDGQLFSHSHWSKHEVFNMLNAMHEHSHHRKTCGNHVYSQQWVIQDWMTQSYPFRC